MTVKPLQVYTATTVIMITTQEELKDLPREEESLLIKEDKVVFAENGLSAEEILLLQEMAEALEWLSKSLLCIKRLKKLLRE